MEARADSPSPARWLRGRANQAPRRPRPFALIALGVVLLLSGCGSGARPHPTSASLIAGERAAPLPPAQLALAVQAARRFGAAYSAAIYSARPPVFSDATGAVRRDLAAAATRVPLDRRRRHPRAVAVHVDPLARDRVGATVTIDDGVARPFAIAYTLRPRGGRWRVVSISTPE